MKNTIYIFFFLAGCATFSNSQNEFYHSIAVKPSIIESDLGNGELLETVSNPYNITIVTTIDCDNEALQRTITIKNNSTANFKTNSDTDHNCSVLYWKVN